MGVVRKVAADTNLCHRTTFWCVYYNTKRKEGELVGRFLVSSTVGLAKETFLRPLPRTVLGGGLSS